MTQDNGYNKAPERYTQGERETVDRMRDLCRLLAGFILENASPEELASMDALGDMLFFGASATHSLKYIDRDGHKGGDDAGKARWWAQMARHAAVQGKDPRAGREGFVPWTPQDLKGAADAVLMVTGAAPIPDNPLRTHGACGRTGPYTPWSIASTIRHDFPMLREGDPKREAQLSHARQIHSHHVQPLLTRVAELEAELQHALCSKCQHGARDCLCAVM